MVLKNFFFLIYSLCFLDICVCPETCSPPHHRICPPEHQQQLQQQQQFSLLTKSYLIPGHPQCRALHQLHGVGGAGVSLGEWMPRTLGLPPGSLVPTHRVLAAPS